METLIFNGTYSGVNESQCSVRSENSTIYHSDNAPSLEGIESSVDSEYSNTRYSDYSDSDFEKDSGIIDFYKFNNEINGGEYDVPGNYENSEFWQFPHFEPPSLELETTVQDHDNYIINGSAEQASYEPPSLELETTVQDHDNYLINASVDQPQYETQDSAAEHISSQYCDNTNYDLVDTPTNMSQEPIMQLFNCDIPNDIVSTDNLDVNNEAIIISTEISVNDTEGQSNLDLLQSCLLEDFGKETNVRRQVEKQHKSSYVNCRIVKMLPEHDDQIEAILQGGNIDEENFDIFNFVHPSELNDVNTNNNTETLEKKPEVLSPKIEVDYTQVVEQIEIKQEIAPKEEIKIESNVIEEYNETKQMIKFDSQKSTLINDVKPAVAFKPKVAGRKRIDMRAQRYIPVDDDEENVDVVTVSKGDNPVIEARDVDSLLAQFEATQLKESKKRGSLKEKISIKDDKPIKKSKKQTKKLKDLVTKNRNALKKEIEKLENLDIATDKSSKYNCSNQVRKQKALVKQENLDIAADKSSKYNSSNLVREQKAVVKQEDLKSKDKKSSKSSSSNRNQILKPDYSKKDNSKRRSDLSVPEKDTTRSDRKIRSEEKQSSTKNKQATKPKPEQHKESISKTPIAAEVPKELIGRIKEAPRPRQIKLLDSCPFLTDPVMDKKKNKTKPKTTSDKSGSNKSNSSINQTVSNGTSVLKQTTNSIGTTTTSKAKPSIDSSRHFSNLKGTTAVTSVPCNVATSTPNRYSNAIGSRPAAIPLQTKASNSKGTSTVTSVPCNVATNTPNRYSNAIGSRPAVIPLQTKASNSKGTTTVTSVSCNVATNTPNRYSNAMGSRPTAIPLQTKVSANSGSGTSSHRDFSSFPRPTSSKSLLIPKPLNKQLNNSNTSRPMAVTNSLRRLQLNTSSSDASTSTDPRKRKRENDLQAVILDHSYHRPASPTNQIETKENAELKVPQNGHPNNNCSPKNNSIENNDVKPLKPQAQDNDPTKNTCKPKKKVVNLEEYRQKLAIPKSKSTVSTGDDKPLNHEEWVKKMGLEVDPPASKEKEQPPAPARVFPPDLPPGIVRRETRDVAISACIAEESALRQMERLEEIKPLLQKANVKISQNSFISCFNNPVPNKIEVNTNRQHEECRPYEVTIRYSKETNVVKPQTASVGVQTNISLIPKKAPERSISISSGSSDDESYSSHDSRYSRNPRKRSRSERSPYRTSCSSSTLQMDNSKSEMPKMFRNRAEHDEYRRDAQQRRILFVGEFGDDMTEEMLFEIFERYGIIKFIKLFKKREKRMKTENGSKSNNFAFITFTDSNAVYNSINRYKNDYPDGENFKMCYGGRREFCKEEYSDLDHMPANFQYYVPRHYNVPSFDSMLEDYKKRRNIPT